MQDLPSSEIRKCEAISRGTAPEPRHGGADAPEVSAQTQRSAQRLAKPASAKQAPEWWSWADIIRNADQLGIPNFQRGAVWDSGNRTALLEAIYEQSPCGSFVLWAPDDAPDSSRRHGVPLRGFAADVQPKWLVDGQQRTRAMLDTFQEVMGLPGDSSCQLVRKADIDELRGHGKVLLGAGDGLPKDTNDGHDSPLWVVVLPAMTVFDRTQEPYFGPHSESRSVRRGPVFRRLHPRASLRQGDDGKTRPVPPLPVGIVPLATLLSPHSVFHYAELRERAVAALRTFGTDAPDFVSLDDLLPWGPQFATGYAFRPMDGEPARVEPIRWAALHARRREGDVAEMVKRLVGLFEPEWSEDSERFKDMLCGHRFAVGWLPSSDVSAAIDAYVRINRAGIRVREEERALALLSRAWPQLLDELAEFIRRRDGGGAVRDQRALLVHESDRQLGFGFWMTTVTRYAALALLGGTACRWLGASAIDKETFVYRLDRVGPKESEVGRKTWARQYTRPGDLIAECAQRATSALILIDEVLSKELSLDHRMARPSARALYPLVDLLYRVPTGELERLRKDEPSFRAAVARLLHWTLLFPYIDQPDLEQLIVKVHDADKADAPVSCWNGGAEAVGEELRQAFRRYQRKLLDLWRQKRGESPPPPGKPSIKSHLIHLACEAFESEVGTADESEARSLQHPAVGWLYALERRGSAREFSWKAQVEAFGSSGGDIGVKRGEPAEEVLRSADGTDLYPEKQHIVPFSVARQIVGKSGTRATRSHANDIGNLTWLSHRQNGLEALGDRWTAMDRDRDADNLAARGMTARTEVDGADVEVLGIYEALRNRVLGGNACDAMARELFATLRKGRRRWMIEQMRAWLEEQLPAGAREWLGDEARAK